MNTTARAVEAPSLQLPDEEIVRRVRAGEVALFEVLMRRHNPLVYRAIRGILRDEAEVEDAMQQAYLNAFVNLGDFAGAAAFSTWLVRIALNEALACLRRGARLEVVAEVPENAEALMECPPGNPEDRAAAREAIHLLEAAVDRLPPAYRSVFMLREVQQLSTAEAADSLGLSEENVKVRLHRARLALKDALLAEVGPSAAAAFPFLAPRCNRVVASVMARISSRSA
jgi:RNA polymerase sigma-70 factor (ECF subfamily)